MKKDIKKVMYDWVFLTGLAVLLIIGVVFILSTSTVKLSGKIEADGFFKYNDSYSEQIEALEIENALIEFELEMPIILLYNPRSGFENFGVW